MLLLAGCASLPAAQATPAQAGAVAPNRQGTGNAPERSASDELLEQSRSERAAGKFAAATRSLEQALRINPDDPALWLEFAELEHAQGDDEQARVMARKAIALAGGDATITSRASQLLE